MKNIIDSTILPFVVVILIGCLCCNCSRKAVSDNTRDSSYADSLIGIVEYDPDGEFNNTINCRAKSIVCRNDSLIENEFFFDEQDIVCFKCSHLHIEGKEVNHNYHNKPPFISFFDTDIQKIEITLYDGNSGCEETVDSTTYVYESDGIGDFKSNNENRSGISCDVIRKSDIIPIFKDVVSLASNNVNITDFHVNENLEKDMDSLIQYACNWNFSHEVTAKDIIDSLTEYPSYLKSRAFMNFIKIKMWNTKKESLTISDCSERFPTGIIWIFKRGDNYLQCYDIRIMDFVKKHISSNHQYYKYLNLGFSLLLQFETLIYDANNATQRQIMSP